MEVLSGAENLLDECSGIPSTTITSAQIAWDNCQPFCSVVDCNTGFFPQNKFFFSEREASHALVSLFVFTLPVRLSFYRSHVLNNAKNGLFCSLVSCKFCYFLRKALQLYEQRSQTYDFHLECLRIWIFTYLFIPGWSLGSCLYRRISSCHSRRNRNGTRTAH